MLPERQFWMSTSIQGKMWRFSLTKGKIKEEMHSYSFPGIMIITNAYICTIPQGYIHYSIWSPQSPQEVGVITSTLIITPGVIIPQKRKLSLRNLSQGQTNCTSDDTETHNFLASTPFTKPLFKPTASRYYHKVRR